MKKAFTLAEVLITLGIIGVVAAMTLPTLIQKQQEKVTVARLKKIYSVLQQSYMLMELNYGSIDTWANVAPTESTNEAQSQSVKFITDRFVENMKKGKVCTHAQAEKCGFVAVVKNLAETTTYSITGLGYRAYWTAMDANFGLTVGSFDCSSINGSTKQLQSTCGNIYADINGNKPPNAFGKDIFLFYLTKYGIVPYGVQNATSSPFETNCNMSTVSSWTAGYGCTAWVIYNENMDYLRCNDLSWNGKKKCSK